MPSLFSRTTCSRRGKKTSCPSCCCHCHWPRRRRTEGARPRIKYGTTTQTLAVLKTTYSSPLPGTARSRDFEASQTLYMLRMPLLRCPRTFLPLIWAANAVLISCRKFCAVWCPCRLQWSSWRFFCVYGQIEEEDVWGTYWRNSSRIRRGNL